MPSPTKPTIDPSSTPAQNTQVPAAVAYSSPIGSAGTKVSFGPGIPITPATPPVGKTPGTASVTGKK
ncbi:unnamed protein product [Hapterophycus canaliculatus]